MAAEDPADRACGEPGERPERVRQPRVGRIEVTQQRGAGRDDRAARALARVQPATGQRARERLRGKP